MRKKQPEAGEPSASAKGRPAHRSTAATRNIVSVGLSCGLYHNQIAAQLGIDAKTLGKHYGDLLKTGADGVHVRVASNMIKASLGGGPKAIEAGKFVLERRFGWKPPRHEVQHAGAVGSYDLTKVSDDDLDKIEHILREATVSGTDPR